jgi:hypothetical protein
MMNNPFNGRRRRAGGNPRIYPEMPATTRLFQQFLEILIRKTAMDDEGAPIKTGYKLFLQEQMRNGIWHAFSVAMEGVIGHFFAGRALPYPATVRPC